MMSKKNKGQKKESKFNLLKSASQAHLYLQDVLKYKVPLIQNISAKNTKKKYEKVFPIKEIQSSFKDISSDISRFNLLKSFLNDLDLLSEKEHNLDTNGSQKNVSCEEGEIVEDVSKHPGTSCEEGEIVEDCSQHTGTYEEGEIIKEQEIGKDLINHTGSNEEKTISEQGSDKIKKTESFFFSCFLKLNSLPLLSCFFFDDEKQWSCPEHFDDIQVVFHDNMVMVFEFLKECIIFDFQHKKKYPAYLSFLEAETKVFRSSEPLFSSTEYVWANKFQTFESHIQAVVLTFHRLQEIFEKNKSLKVNSLGTLLKRIYFSLPLEVDQEFQSLSSLTKNIQVLNIKKKEVLNRIKNDPLMVSYLNLSLKQFTDKEK